MKLIDLSHVIEPGMPMFSEKAPQPVIEPWMSHSQAAESGTYVDCTCEISYISFVTSLGTYLDSPYHFDSHGKSIDLLELNQLVLPGIVIDCTGIEKRQPIQADCLDGQDIEGRAVLFKTGWSKYWGMSEYYSFPYLTRDTARVLVQRKAKLAGVDFLVINDPDDPERPVHVDLLHNQILIVENLTNLSALPKTGFTFHAVPVKAVGAAAFPVRAYAMSDNLNTNERKTNG